MILTYMILAAQELQRIRHGCPSWVCMCRLSRPKVLYGNGLVMVNFRWKKKRFFSRFFHLYTTCDVFEIFGTMSAALMLAMMQPPLKVRFLVSYCVLELVAKCLTISDGTWINDGGSKGERALHSNIAEKWNLLLGILLHMSK